MQIDIPDVKAEVAAAFARYEVALVTNDVATLTELFWADHRTLRYGGGENLHGIAEIEAFRERHESVVMKPLYGHGGAAVFRVTRKEGYRALDTACVLQTFKFL